MYFVERFTKGKLHNDIASVIRTMRLITEHRSQPQMHVDEESRSHDSY